MALNERRSNLKIVRVVNVIFALVALSLSFYHLVYNSISLPTNYINSFLAFMFLSFGIEDLLKQEKDKKPFNLYLLASIVLFAVLGAEMLKTLT
ncbi:hypothetical protein [Pontibacillus yanchengensis]|uniref:DUF3953 domain-containing protein n=1 Tax=Pontibacillus yanchengensis Y32 TaxID=1385514 RepID=A0A0A2T9E8_9BACI|nr:hypothetical protein [Pontibacillus yanchengensis]KGP71033.1 hypothetical protein N782_01845 [Pontibacillus yanchengensis Y32]